jgi:hypothetical protein
MRNAAQRCWPLLLLVVLVGATPQRLHSAELAPRPNILLIVSDDQQDVGPFVSGRSTERRPLPGVAGEDDEEEQQDAESFS